MFGPCPGSICFLTTLVYTLRSINAFQTFQWPQRPSPAFGIALQATPVLSQDEDTIEWDEDEIDLSLTAQDYHEKWQELAVARSSTVQDAQELLDRQFQHFLTAEDAAFQPTLEDYECMLHVYATHGAAKDAQLVYQRLQDQVSLPDPTDETLVYVLKACKQDIAKILELAEGHDSLAVRHQLLKSYGQAGLAEKALEYLDAWAEEESPPDDTAFLQVCRAYSRQEDVQAVQSLLQRTDEWTPDTEAYNTWLSAMKANDALQHFNEWSQEPRNGCQPNDDSVRAVLHTYRRDYVQAHQIKLMLQMARALQLTPSRATIRMALSAMSRSRDPHKVFQMQQVWQQDGDPEDLDYYHAVLLNAAAYIPKKASPQVKHETFVIAVEAVRQVTKVGPKINFLRACRTLMPPSDKRDAVFGAIFRDICREGLCNERVWREFSRGASEDLQRKLLRGRLIADGAEPERKWQRNL